MWLAKSIGGCAVVAGWLILQAALVCAEDSRSGPIQQGQGNRHTRFTVPMGLSIQAFTFLGSHTVLAGSFGSGIFRSDDRGQSWVSTNEGLTDPFVLSLVTAPDGTVYAGTFRAGVFRSQDRGKSWHALNKGLQGLQVKALLVTKNALYAGTGQGVDRYSKDGDQWRVVAKGMDNILVHCLAVAADGALYAGTSGKGVLRYKARASGWRRLSGGLVDHEGLVENFIRVLVVDRQQAIYAGTFDGGVFRSTDHGQTWKPISRALPNDSIRGIVVNRRGLFVATGRGIFKSQNHGREWSPINEGLTELSVQVLLGSGGNSLYAGTSAGAFRSDDDGRTWISINDGLTGSSRSPFDILK